MKVRVAAVAVIGVLVVGVAVRFGPGLVPADAEEAGRPVVRVPKVDAPLRQPTTAMTFTPDLPLVQNGLYKAGRVPAVSCRMPVGAQTSRAAVLAAATVVLDCLDRSWVSVVARSGHYFESPGLVVFDRAKDKSCELREIHASAFYCSKDNKIYLEWKDYLQRGNWNRQIDLLDTMAHEYGHHLQRLAGILSYGWDPEASQTSAAALLKSRRLELQATCFGAAFLGANKTSLRLTGERLRTWQHQTRHSGDEYSAGKLRDHGSRQSQWRWAAPAFQSANPSSCNTFTAATTKVS
ncbi:neutral zinc metallopeptidase [Kribbella sp. CA-293567]|uniref:neutral zinc metallopeptidase n=1 Tax=Kribbella sp. CA-293567 TaxID=3002436 RepID=UPI0022DE0D7A|nr:neutral zinc metallopeptidase [Kribbella sp. CA-293567]WBQ04299.1 neutral zinc metallopeptidase [Kribbella sp. CA-293567]